MELAKKVDILRKSLSELHDQHRFFAEKSKEELHRETLELQQILQGLKGEVSVLQEQRKELLRPLDAEWSKLKTEKFVFENERELVRKKDQELDVERQMIGSRIKQIEIKLTKIEKQDRESENKARQAEQDFKNSKRILRDAQKKSEEIYANLDAREKEVLSLEEKIKFEK